MDVLLSAAERQWHFLREMTWSGLFQNNNNNNNNNNNKKTIQNNRNCHFVDTYYVPDTLFISSLLIFPTNLQGNYYSALTKVVEMLSFEEAQAHTDNMRKLIFKAWFPDSKVCNFQPCQWFPIAGGRGVLCGTGAAHWQHSLWQSGKKPPNLLFLFFIYLFF